MEELIFFVKFCESIFGNDYSTRFDALNYTCIILFIFFSIFSNTRSLSFIGSGGLLFLNICNALTGYSLAQNSGAYLLAYFTIMLSVYLLEEKSNTTTIHS
ncbi:MULTISPECIES: hypothetical protein [unclassified Campylobacter]|uniref:hypothetical protein n=1 Tax=unclassified Campylobacter TaxID=2593542 RepID=UPI001D4FD43F|nr:hypothetical protein [Campylobacter sp. RM12651]MBZ7978519.1 hypothetical protein [Campylobacter sp. RM12654]MBZ7980436.1 hypothetical protein [Campylobacter sp. RM12642]MBZ7990595.1 hypothetical protein [Campylobacter sp. RM9331]MBZ8004766.1 hypothetical protein [Campylobacter sp. RM9332]MBZ8007117.1 hypothetical protein [Campylobacter sp. RM9334]